MLKKKMPRYPLSCMQLKSSPKFPIQHHHFFSLCTANIQRSQEVRYCRLALPDFPFADFLMRGWKFFANPFFSLNDPLRELWWVRSGIISVSHCGSLSVPRVLIHGVFLFQLIIFYFARYNDIDLYLNMVYTQGVPRFFPGGFIRRTIG